jgi:hypothetical protein
MHTYFVQSGPLKITIVADTAYDAALEAIRWWDAGDAVADNQSEARHRQCLDPAVEVRPDPKSRISRRFATFNLLARAAGESPSAAWERLLRERIGQVN